MPASRVENAPTGRRAERKRRDILRAAREVFLANGYAGASITEVAARADASKVTVYRHFRGKEALFVAVVESAIEEAEDRSRAVVEALAESTDLAADLRAFARQHVEDVTQPHLVRMRRMVIAEAERFPALARAWHRRAPRQAHRTLGAVIRRLEARGELTVDDAELAAEHLNYLILAAPLDEAMFTARTTPFPRARLHRWADEAVRVFLATYGPKPP
jgi:TetR/AcrR family transcriptional regulator, mexJK operon transcriptional repressor